MHSLVEDQETIPVKLKGRVLIPFAVACIFLFVISVSSIYLEEKEHVEADFHNNIIAIEKNYAGLVHNSVSKLSLALAFILENKQIKRAFREKNRDKLLAVSKPIFDKLHAHHGVTHFYLHDNQRKNYLRVHRPARYGDTINRFSAIKAEENRRLAWGVELGPLGTFTVRVVAPLWDDTQQIGYVELGEEIKKETGELASMFGVKLALLVSKEFLSREGWQLGMQMMNRKGEWDQLAHFVVSFASPHDFPVSIFTTLALSQLSSAEGAIELDVGSQSYWATFIPITDAGDRNIGNLLVVKDFTSRIDGVRRTAFFLSLIAFVLSSLLLGLFYFVLDRAERQLERRQQRVVAATQAKLDMQQAHMLEMEYQSLHDALSGLPNRKVLDQRLSVLIKDSKEEEAGYVLMLMDVDRMREINDTLGHDVGDHVLQEVGQRLKVGMADAEIVACLGGNEFAVLLPTPPPALMGISVKRVKQLFEEPITVDKVALSVELTIGVAKFPEHGNEASVLIRRADVAMRQAKIFNKGCELYDSDMDNYSVRRLTLVGELRKAIDAGELMVYYQPQINVESGRLEGVEALARWRHPIQGFIGPDEFIPLAERTGLIGSLTHWVMKTALSQCAVWMKEGLDIKISINISAHNLMDLSLPSKVAVLLKEYQLAPEKLVLEVTESVFMLDPDRSLIVLDELNSLGVALSIDDYGTGYSSLAYLRKLPVHELKIDQGFIFEMLGNDNDAMIVSSTVALAHSLGLSVVAEGVETEEAWKHLQALGCDTIQGYFISAPLPPESFIEWIDGSTNYDPRV